ncbi:MAG: RNA-binding protein [Nanoarchaeota archaeon]|jgi:predicted RNA-binding protein (TIGR00451 family)|nr:RNA-binding protein [Nanoarchaeota archaeon]
MRHLSGKEKKQINEMLWDGYELDKKCEAVEDGNIILKDSKKYLIILEKNKKSILKVIPHLKTLNEETFKSVYIDAGAIPFLIKGADMMRPGIQKIDEGISQGDIVLVRDETYSKTLAIGEAIYSSEDMQKQEKGISVKILHFMGDEKF